MTKRSIRCGLDEVHDLFDINKSGDVETITRILVRAEKRRTFILRVMRINF